MAVALSLFYVGCSAQLSPGSPPVPDDVSSPTTGLYGDIGTEFRSARYGYSLITPVGWTVTETPGSGGLHPDEPGVDTFRDRRGHTLSVIGEQNVPALTAWTCAIGQHLEGEHELAVETVEDLMLLGEPARVSAYHLLVDPYAIHYLTVEIVRDAQGLTLSLESTTGDDAEDRALLESLLERLSFDEAA